MVSVIYLKYTMARIDKACMQIVNNDYIHVMGMWGYIILVFFSSGHCVRHLA